MAIITETFQVDGRNFIRTTSNAGRYVVRDGIVYEEACDLAEFNRQYIEGDLIPAYSDSELEAKSEAYDILMGASE